MSIYRLASGTVSSAALTTCFAVGTGNTATIANFVLTNVGGAVTSVSVFIYSGATQRLLKVVKLPLGVGKAAIVFEAIGGVNQGDSVAVQSDGLSVYNYHISGKTVAA